MKSFVYVGLYSFQVFVQGLDNLNRAVNDDTVAIEMLPEAEWSCPSSLVLREDEAKDEEDEANVDTTDTVCQIYLLKNCFSYSVFLKMKNLILIQT